MSGERWRGEFPPRMVVCAEWADLHPDSNPYPPWDTGETCYLDASGRWWRHRTLVALNDHASVLDALAELDE